MQWYEAREIERSFFWLGTFLKARYPERIPIHFGMQELLYSDCFVSLDFSVGLGVVWENMPVQSENLMFFLGLYLREYVGERNEQPKHSVNK